MAGGQPELYARPTAPATRPVRPACHAQARTLCSRLESHIAREPEKCHANRRDRDSARAPAKLRGGGGGGGGGTLCVALILLLILCPTAGLAETLTVTSNADTTSRAYATVLTDSDGCRTATGATKQAVQAASTTPLTLREALIRADNNDEPDTIRFDPVAFAPTATTTARTITLSATAFFLPRMCEGNTTIDGDTNGDGTPDVIVQSALTRQQQGGPFDWPAAFLFMLLSDNNTITNLVLRHFYLAGVYVAHYIGATSTPGAISSVTGNTITNTIFDNRTYDPGGVGIRLQAGSSQVARGPGGIRNTTITGNTFLFNDDNNNSGAVHLTTFRARSFIDGTTIGASLTDPPSALATKRNIIRGGTTGIQLTNNGGLVGGDHRAFTDEAITNTTIRGNHLLLSNDGIVPAQELSRGARIWAWSRFGANYRITDLSILDNRIEDYRYNVGIYLAAGICGALNSEMTATIARNTVSGNGGLIPPPPSPPNRNLIAYNIPVDTRPAHGIVVYGGEHGHNDRAACARTTPPPSVRASSNNRLTVTIEDNVVSNNWDTGIAVIGGSYLADANTVTATLSRNRVSNNGRDGIIIIGGRVLRQHWPDLSSPDTPPPGRPVVTGNTVTATLTGNQISGQTAGAGLRLLAGGTGPANTNRVTVRGQGNIFGGTQANRYDIVGQGGVATTTPASLFPSDITTNPRGDLTGPLTALFPANSGTGNQLTGSLTPQRFDPALAVVEDGTSGNTAQLMIRQATSGGGGGLGDSHGDSPQDATEVALSAFGQITTIADFIHSVRDVDYFRLRVPVAGRLLLRTTGRLYTQGTLFEAGAGLATDPASSHFGPADVRRLVSGADGVLTTDRGRGDRPNFQISIPITPGDYLLAVEGTHHQVGPYTLEVSLLIGRLENPRPQSYQSGIGLVSGWVCEAERVEIEVNGTILLEAAYGTSRNDTRSVCDDSDNGFGLLFNWNLLGNGTHTARLLVNGEEVHTATFTVTTLGEEFVRDAAGETSIADFPTPGEQVRLVWQEASQNFTLAPLEGQLTPADPPSGTRAILEVPANGSYQSGIGLVSGWVCEAERVEIEVNGTILLEPAYGTSRNDTRSVCDDSDNGFGLLFNWNLLGDGTHTARLLVNGDAVATATFTVTTLGEEFVRDAAGETSIADFPAPGGQVRLVWQEANQNFSLAPPPTSP